MTGGKSPLGRKACAIALGISLSSLLIASAPSKAEDTDSLSGVIGNAFNSARARSVHSAWARVSPSMLSCMQRQGISGAALSEDGVLPGDRRLQPIFARCRAELRSNPAYSADSPLRHLPEHAPKIEGVKLRVDGFELGDLLDAQSAADKQFRCVPSKTFPGKTWCQRTVAERTRDGDISKTNVILESDDGTIGYVSESISPAHFTLSDIDSEIARLSRRYGNPRILRYPSNGSPMGIIAYWGSLTLVPLDDDAVGRIVADQASGKGFLFDFLSNFRRSAENGFPIYSVSGGEGYVWSANFNASGTGVLHLTAMDTSEIGAPASLQTASAPTAAPSPAVPAPPSQLGGSNATAASSAAASLGQRPAGPGFDVLAHLTEFPSACLAVKTLGPQTNWPRGWARETRDPFSGRYSASNACKSIQECLPSLSVRLKPFVDYLRARPQVYAALKHEAPTSPIMNVDGAIEALNSKVDLSVNDCSLFAIKLDSLMARSGADPGHAGIPAPYEYLQSASRNLISDLQKEHDARDQTYSDWLPYAKHYGRAADLNALARSYENAFSGPDIEPLLVAAQKFDQEMSAANDYKATLLQQGTKLAELSERLADLAQRAGQPPLSKLVEPDESTKVDALRAQVADLGKTLAPDRGDVAARLSQFETAANQFQDQLKAAQDKLDAMSRQSAKLTEMSKRLIDLAQQASQDSISKLIKPEDLSTIEKLRAEIDRLARTPVPERGDVAGRITQFEAGIRAFENDLKGAQAKADSTAATRAKEDADAAQGTLRAKGIAYANESGTTWTSQQAKNAMTDKMDYTAISVQKPTPGVEAEITATCSDRSWLEFEALITDDNGKPTLEFPGLNGEIGVLELRKNEEEPTFPLLNLRNIRVTFSNKFRLGVIPLGQVDADTQAVMKDNPLFIDLNTTWRYMVKIETSAGPAVLTIPLFADAIQTVIAKCRR